MSLHAVQFYRDEKTMFDTVAAFVAAGLGRNEPAVIIATPQHRSPILASLARTVDVVALRQTGRLVVRDADDVLSGFMVRGMPDEGLFDQQMSAFIESVSGVEEQTVHIYGQTANLLWQRGTPAAALALERCGNRLAGRYAMSILCSYALDDNYDTPAFERICGEHSHIVSTSGHSRVAL